MPSDPFARAAARYAAHRPTYPPALARFLAERCSQHTLAWDCGCGSGQLSVLLAAEFRNVIATDASAAQIKHATQHPRIEYRRASAEVSGLPDSTVDLAAAAQAAHWFDLTNYYAEVMRVARPGAAIALVTYGMMTIDPNVDAVVNDFYSQVLGPHWPPERRHVDQGYQTLPFPFDEIRPPELEMVAEWSFEDVIGYIETWSAVCALLDSGGRAALDSFRQDLARAWANDATPRSIRWPLSLRVGRV